RARGAHLPRAAVRRVPRHRLRQGHLRHHLCPRRQLGPRGARTGHRVRGSGRPPRANGGCRMTTIGILAGLLPQSIMNTQWFAVLSMFVAINTLLYLTVAIVKLLPKVYLSDWVDRGNRRS